MTSEDVMRDGSQNLDHNFAFGAAAFDIGQCIVGGREWKDLIDDRSDGTRLNERCDLPQLASAGFHEEK